MTRDLLKIDEAVVERAAEAAWPEFRSGMEESSWKHAPEGRKERLRIIVRAAFSQHPEEGLLEEWANRPLNYTSSTGRYEGVVRIHSGESVGVEAASLPALWRLREDNGEEHTEYDKGFEAASDECARMLEAALTQQPAAEQCPDCKGVGRGGRNTTDGGAEDDCSSCSGEGRVGRQPAAVDDGAVFRLAVWMAKQDGHDDPHHLIWEGSPPEPWGEVWNRYEDNARAALTAAIAKATGGES